MKFKGVLLALAAVLALATVGAAAGAATAPTVPDVVGVCANTKNGGYLRMLEARNIVKSRWGKCRANEQKVPLLTSSTTRPRGLDSGPFKLTLNGGAAYVCTWTATSSTLACIAPSPSPSPSASS